MTGFGFTTPLFISVMLLSQVVTSKEIEVPLEAKSLDHETAYPYEPPSDLITPEIQRGLHVLFQRELEHYEFDENNHDISGNYEEVNSYLWLLGYLEIEPVNPDSKPFPAGPLPRMVDPPCRNFCRSRSPLAGKG